MALKLLAAGATSPGFQLALRRSLFFLILLTTYLLGGALVFTILSHEAVGGVNGRADLHSAHLDRLDFARAELLSVIWAEAIGLAERDWSVLANQKMDIYEQMLLRTYSSTGGTALLEYGRERKGYRDWFRHCFLLATTIGGVSLAELSPLAKILSVLYSLIGIPLTLIYIGHCAKSLQALLQIDVEGRRKGVGGRILLLALLALVATAVVLDCVEGNDDGDLPFLDALTILFLAFATIGASEQDAEILPTWLLYLSSIVSLAVFSLIFVQIQSTLERWISGYEWAFMQQVGRLERVLSVDRLSNVQEETEESGSGDGDTDGRRRDNDITVEHLFTLNSGLPNVVEEEDESQ